MKKRILSILLCCVMLAGMLPSVAFAEGGTGSLTVTINGFQVDNTPNECTYTFSSTIPGVTFSEDDIQYISWEKYAADDDLYLMNNTDVFRVDTRYRCVIQLDNNGLTEVPAVTVNGNTPDYCTLPYFGGVAQVLSIGCDIGTPQVNPALVEQFPGLTPGETYWFDLSGADIPGNKNGSLPDDSLHWVPFTYVGTVSAYVLKSRSANDNTARSDAANAAGSTDPSNPIGYTYDHSLFIADYNVTSTDWNNLNGRNLIFGTAYTSGGVDYTLRAPSAGSNGTASGGTPASNEWDAILDKANQSYQDNTVGYIKNWNGMESWGQDTKDGPDPEWNRATRGYITARSWLFALQLSPSVGFRPVLELPSSDTLGSDGLATVTLDLNGGSIGSITGTINFAVKSDFNLTLPGGTDVTRPDGNDGTYFMWQDSGGNLYEPGAQVPANVGRLTALWKDSINPVITGLENGKTYCDAVEFEVSDNDGIASVKAGNNKLTAGTNGKYTLEKGIGTVTVVATDKAGNASVEITVTINDGHTAGNDDGDCSTPVYCIYHPDTVVVAAKSHDFSGEWHNDGTGHWHVCQNDGCTVSEPKASHFGTDDGDCTTAVICECGYTITAANAEHSYGEWQSKGDGTHTRYCTVDGCSGYEDGNCTGGEATCTSKAICEYCKTEYGEFDSSNHNLEKIPAKDATVTETGNKEYWHCKDCKKYFSDAAGTNEIKLDDTIISKLSPEIIEGKGQSITAGEKKELTFKSNAAFSDFIRFELDGKTLDEKNYTVKEGSTIVTLKADYVATLSVGEHTIGIVSTNGAATTTFTVKAKTAVDNDTDSPQTGDNSNMALWIALLAASVFGLAGTAVYSKRKRVR